VASHPNPDSAPASRASVAPLGNDLSLAWRALRRTPGYAVVAIATLALGLALVASTLALVNAYLIRALPFPASHRLFHVIYAPVGQPEPRGLTALDWRGLSDVVEVADSTIPARFSLREGGSFEVFSGLQVSAGSLEAIGVRVVQGRPFSAEEFKAGAEQVALISHEMWRDRLGGDPQIVGKQLRAGGGNPGDPIASYRILGVLPPEFHSVRDYARGIAHILVPLRVPMRTYLIRLREGVPPAYAEQRLTDVARGIATSVPPGWGGIKLESVQARYVAGLKPVLTAVSVAAGLVLLIVVANLSVLTLLRALRRQKEIAIRVALGANRRDIARLLLAEAALVCGCALGVALVSTTLVLRLWGPVIEARLGRPIPGGASALSLDPTVLLGVGGAGLAVALALAVLPILTLWHRGLGDALRREGRSGTDRPSTRRLRAGLIVLEVAASLALLVGGGLMIRSVLTMVGTPLGFSTEHVLRTRIALQPATKYPDAASFRRFHDRLAARLAEIPRTSFATANFIPFYETPQQTVEIDEGASSRAGLLAVSDGYFSTLRIAVRQGRSFAAADQEGVEPVAIVSETLARRLWPGGNALGGRLRTADQPVPNSPLTEWRTVVGIVADVHQTPTDTDLNDIYIPLPQAPNRYCPLYLRSELPAADLSELVRSAIAAIDPDVVPTDGLTPLQLEGDRLLAGPRFLMTILTGFAGFAALLALLGIYGVTAYAVQQREREVAIRIALGAPNTAVVRLFLRAGGRQLAGGVVLGLIGASGVARVLASQIHGVQPFDATTLTASAGFIVVAGLLATWWPARRATTRNPLSVLKEE
jgi:putative ABC transport system permease protein